MQQKNQAQQPQQLQAQQQRINNFDWIIKPSFPSKEKTKTSKISTSSTIKNNGIGGLALGNIRFVQDFQQLQKQGIGAIISVFGQKELNVDTSIKHLRILISDNPRENIKCFFPSSNQFLKQNIIQTNVLVHCHAGISRSATVVAAYLMKFKKMKDKEALDFIRNQRPQIFPNKGFIKQLKQYNKELQQQKSIIASSSSFCEIF